MNHRLPPVPALIRVGPLVDPVLDAVGMEPSHAYLEEVWLSQLGPSATLAYRKLARAAAASDVAAVVDSVTLATSLGLADGPQRLRATLGRLVRFDLARFFTPDDGSLPMQFWVRLRFAPVWRSLLARQVPVLMPVHDAMLRGLGLDRCLALLEWSDAQQLRATRVTAGARP